MVFLVRLKRSKGLFIIVLLTAALLFGIQQTGFHRPGLSKGEEILRSALAPLQSGVMIVSNKVSGFLSYVTSIAEVRVENERLKDQVNQLITENNRLIEYRQENARLRKLLSFQEAVGSNYSLIAARVIARNPENWYSTLSIDKGQIQGIEKNMPVINDVGLVGRVINVAPDSAEVLLIIDREGAVGGMVQQSRVPGVVEGYGPNTDLLQMIHLAHDAPVYRNQVVITSGLGGIFPKGLRIGYVNNVVPEANGLMKRAYLQPFVDFDRLEEVMVITGVNTE